MTNGEEAINNVWGYIEELGWEPQKTDDEEIIKVDFAVDEIPVSEIVFDIRAYYERFICYFNFIKPVPKDRITEVMNYITNVNFDLIIGNFELDIETGLVRFKSSIDFTSIKLSETLFRNTLKSGMDNVEEYSDVLLRIINNEINSDQAKELVD